MITVSRESAIKPDTNSTASQRVFPYERKITTKGIPETLAEIYGGHSSGKDEKLELFLFDVQNLPKIHELNNGRFVESYKFVNAIPKRIKDEVLTISRNQGIILHFSQRQLEDKGFNLQPREEIYYSTLENRFYGEICNILGTLQEKYR